VVDRDQAIGAALDAIETLVQRLPEGQHVKRNTMQEQHSPIPRPYSPIASGEPPLEKPSCPAVATAVSHA
jgi:hypothetical protein